MQGADIIQLVSAKMCPCISAGTSKSKDKHMIVFVPHKELRWREPKVTYIAVIPVFSLPISPISHVGSQMQRKGHKNYDRQSEWR